MPDCFFVSDIHGSIERYDKLFKLIRNNPPRALFMGGDLLPSGIAAMSSLDVSHRDFVNDYLAYQFEHLRDSLGERYPQVFVILGNDDPRFEEAAVLDVATRDIWEYIQGRRIIFEEYFVYGYAYVPPSPFLLKDWERYDVSRYVDPGCISPEEGLRSVPVAPEELRNATIQRDLDQLVGGDNLDKAIFLFHSPPYKTNLDRAALDGKSIDHVPLDVHVGSIAIRKFMENRQPLITLHGHIHESARLTGQWQDRLGRTVAFTAAHDGPELSVVQFDPGAPIQARRLLI